MTKHIGGNFDDFLTEQAMLEEVAATAWERISAHNPLHPGETLHDDVLSALGLTVRSRRTASRDERGTRTDR